MVGAPLLRLALRGTSGPLDEIITLIPVGMGGVLLPYLCFAARPARQTRR